jgi:hypothetical protein
MIHSRPIPRETPQDARHAIHARSRLFPRLALCGALGAALTAFSPVAGAQHVIRPAAPVQLGVVVLHLPAPPSAVLVIVDQPNRCQAATPRRHVRLCGRISRTCR